jgi:hypothetical protein
MDPEMPLFRFRYCGGLSNQLAQIGDSKRRTQ